jgi:uncharacterized protein YjiS (DUF1127 family)
MLVGAISRLRQIDARVANRLPGIFTFLTLWHRRAASRAALRELSPEHLRDIGITKAEAAHEAMRPFWEG